MMKKSYVQQAGFTLFEVLISIVVLTSAVFFLTNLQLRSLFRIESDCELIRRIYLIKKELYLGLVDPESVKKVNRKEFEDPAMRVVISAQALEKKSPLYKFRSKIGLVVSQGIWRTDQTDRKEEIVGLVEVSAGSDIKESE